MRVCSVYVRLDPDLHMMWPTEQVAQAQMMLMQLLPS